MNKKNEYNIIAFFQKEVISIRNNYFSLSSEITSIHITYTAYNQLITTDITLRANESVSYRLVQI